jgi:hypothetical protein
MAFCGNCGAEIETGAKFCGGCGQPVGDVGKGGPEEKIQDVSLMVEPSLEKRGRWKKSVILVVILLFVVGVIFVIGSNLDYWVQHNKFGLGKLSWLYPSLRSKETKISPPKPAPVKPIPAPPAPAQPSAEVKAPEAERFVYSKPIPVEPRPALPEDKLGISYMGVEIQNLTKEVADSVGLLEGSGVLVRSVKPGGPAASAGILPGDVILKFKDTFVTDVRILSELVKSTPSGTRAPVYIQRRGKRQHLTVVVGGLRKEDLALTPTPPYPPSRKIEVQNRQYYETGAKQALDNKDFQKLRLILDEGLTHYPDSGALWSYEGAYYLVYNESGPWSFRSEKALKAAQKAVDLDPTQTNYNNLGLAYHYMFKDYFSALTYYEKVGNYALSNPRVYYNMAICYEELKYLHLAVSHYEKFLKVAPNDKYAQDARNRLARLR